MTRAQSNDNARLSIDNFVTGQPNDERVRAQDAAPNGGKIPAFATRLLARADQMLWHLASPIFMPSGNSRMVLRSDL